MPAARRHAITGGPGAGKSTLLAELERRGVATVPEVARRILQEPGGMALRSEKPSEFALAMLAAQREAWDGAADFSPIIYDRGFPDIVGFLRLEGLPVPPDVDRACRNLRFAGPVFYAPPWQDIYRQDDERIQNWLEAKRSGEEIARAWRDYGYELVPIPLVNPEKRAEFVLGAL